MAMTDYFTGLQHVGIPTKDLDATIKFYQLLGFEQVGAFMNGGRVAFMKRENLTIETWETDNTAGRSGAIDHLSMNTTDVDKAFAEAKKLGLALVDEDIQSIPSFWEHGIRFFNVKGPNQETIEFCQILSK